MINSKLVPQLFVVGLFFLKKSSIKNKNRGEQLGHQEDIEIKEEEKTSQVLTFVIYKLREVGGGGKKDYSQIIQCVSERENSENSTRQGDGFLMGQAARRKGLNVDKETRLESNI